MPQTDLQSLLKPEILNSIKGLELLSRMVIGDFAAGYNKSVYSGQGFEFRQYRSYQRGDDLRLLDWKMLARSDRYYIKESESEKNIKIYFIIDASASMQHKDHNGIQKIEFLRFIAASLGYLAIQQGDAIGLFAYNDRTVQYLPAKTDTLHFQRFLFELTQIKATSTFSSQSILELSKHSAAQQVMYVFVTDFYEENNEIKELLKHTTALKNEFLLFQLMAENEIKLNMEGNFNFIDLETHRTIQLNPSSIRSSYLNTLEDKLSHIKKECLDMGVHYQCIVMNEPLEKTISSFLLSRKRLV